MPRAGRQQFDFSQNSRSIEPEGLNGWVAGKNRSPWSRVHRVLDVRHGFDRKRHCHSISVQYANYWQKHFSIESRRYRLTGEIVSENLILVPLQP